MEKTEYYLGGYSAYNFEYHISTGIVVTPKNGQKPITLTAAQWAELTKNKTFNDQLADKVLRQYDHIPARFADNSASIAEANAKARDADQKAKKAQADLAEREKTIADLQAKIQEAEGTDEVQKKLAEQDALIADLQAKLAIAKGGN